MLLSRMLRKDLFSVSSCGAIEGAPGDLGGGGGTKVSIATAFTCVGCLTLLCPHCSFRRMPRWPANGLLLVLPRQLLEATLPVSLGC